MVKSLKAGAASGVLEEQAAGDLIVSIGTGVDGFFCRAGFFGAGTLFDCVTRRRWLVPGSGTPAKGLGRVFVRPCAKGGVMSRFAWMTLVVVGSMWLGLGGWSDTARAQDVRTWSDASGKFKIKGTFKGEKDGVVTIEQEDGEEIEIETKKLSASDQRLVLVLKKEVTDNPFKKKDEDPFKAKGKSGEPRAREEDLRQDEGAGTGGTARRGS